MRFAGINIPDNKQLEIGLTTIYGVGRSRAKEVLDTAGVDHGKKAAELDAKEEAKIRELLEGYSTEGNLKREKSGNIKRLKDSGTYRGTRHAQNLPGRGQRTKTNSRTVRGNVRKTMGSGKRKVEKK